MKQEPRARRRNTISSWIWTTLSDKSGGATLLLGMVCVVVIALFTTLLFQKQQLHMVTGDVSADITAALTSTASSQLYNSYPTIRDGTSGSVMFDGTRYREIKDTDKFRAVFAELYNGIELQGNDIMKKSGGRTVFVISNLRLYVSNASGGAVKSYYRAEYDLLVANSFIWAGSNTVLRGQVQTVEYMNRF